MLNLFDTASAATDSLTRTFAQVAREGLGVGRRAIELISVTTTPVTVDLSPPPEKINRLTVRFLTPTELKSGQQLATSPEFGILAARVRDRLSTLRELYGAGPLTIDFKGYGNRAGEIQMTRCQIEQVKNKRHSTRTGQTHPLSGFVGDAEYTGDLTEFLPYLNAAQWTGVGRQTTWGKGQIEVARCL